MSFDVAALRARFPALAIEQDGRPVALFDGPGGTQVPDTVIEAVTRYYRESNANHGGTFLTSRARPMGRGEPCRAGGPAPCGRSLGDQVRRQHDLADDACRPLDRRDHARGRRARGHELDHEANVGPWRAIARDRGLVVREVDVRTDDVTLDIEAFDAALHGRPRLVAFGWASNAVGSINPVGELVRRAHEAGAWTYVDAVHAAPHVPIDVEAIGTDFLACSTYKFFGPHAGVLYGRAEILDRLPSYKIVPATDRFETGTANMEGIAGAGAAVVYIAEVGARYGPRSSRSSRV